ncbi:hypothetical protein NUM3379_08740 [Kineococcus sp. NUM-3379]
MACRAVLTAPSPSHQARRWTGGNAGENPRRCAGRGTDLDDLRGGGYSAGTIQSGRESWLVDAAATPRTSGAGCYRQVRWS